MKILTAILFLSFVPVKDKNPEVCIEKCKMKYEKCLKRYSDWACESKINVCLNRCD